MDVIDSGTGNESSGKSGTTEARSLAQATAKVARWLRERGELGGSPKEIARGAQVSVRTTYRALRVLGEKGLIHRVFHGHYCTSIKIIDILQHADGRLGLHGLVLVGQGWQITPPGPPSRARADAGDLGQLPLGTFGPWKLADGGYLEYVTEWNRRLVRVKWYGSKRTLDIRIAASVTPIHFGEFGELVGWLTHLCHPVDPLTHLNLTQVSGNVDFPRWRLDGLKSFRLQLFYNAWYSIYHSERKGLRVEVEIAPRDLLFKEALELITEMVPAAVEGRAKLRLAEELRRFREALVGQAVRSYSPPPPIKDDYQGGYA